MGYSLNEQIEQHKQTTRNKDVQLEKLEEALRISERKMQNHWDTWTEEQQEEWSDPEIAGKRRELLFVFQLLEYMDKADLGLISKLLGGAKLMDEENLKWSLRIRAAYLTGHLSRCADITRKKMVLRKHLERDDLLSKL